MHLLSIIGVFRPEYASAASAIRCLGRGAAFVAGAVRVGTGMVKGVDRICCDDM